MSAEFDKVINRLAELGRNPHKNCDGYKSLCPAHDDSRASLSITEGDDGKVLVTCYTGCDFKAIVKSMGMEESDMFPPDPTRKSAAKGKAKSKKGDGWPTFDQAVEYLVWKLAKDDKKKRKVTPGDRWEYGADFVVQRMNYDDGDKEFRPIVRVMGRWQLKVPTGKRPLYHRDELATDAAADTVVVVTEGEKCCDLVRNLGLIATTSSSGANSAHKTDWSDLAGKTVCILPDNDEAGEKYADDVASILAGLEPKPAVKVVRLPLVNQGDDVAEWLENVVPDSWGPEECKAQLLMLAAAAPEWVPKPAAAKPIPSDNDPIVNIRGQWCSCLHNTLLWLAKEGHAAKVRYDRFKHAILVDGRPLDDEAVIGFTAKIEASTRSGWSQEHTRSALIETAHRNEYSSLVAWLDSLKWDGAERLGGFFHDAYACESTGYTRACAEVLFISGVARAYQPGCQADVMVVLIGDQGLGKSMGMAGLCPDPTWYADDLGCDLFDKKAGEGLRGKWMVEFSEFSRINRATLDVAKAFISRRSDYYRPAYGRTHKDYPRTCIFVGTTNDDHPLHDRENRRFMPIRCVKADVEWIKSNRDQLWAEAVVRYRQGAKWWVTVTTLLADVAEKQEEARQGDFWETVLSEKLSHRLVVTMQDAVDALDIDIDRVDKSTQTRIGFALKALGYTRKQVRNGNKRMYEWSR